MSTNESLLRAKYGDGLREDDRASSSRYAGLEFHYTKKALAGYIAEDSRVLEIGCGTGYYGLHFAEKCKEYVGIDLNPPHVEIFRRKIAERGLTNVSCSVGDGTDLRGIPDGSFDVVLCFGPMYHLPPDERELAFAEAARVCKPGGVAAFAYVCGVGLYAGACAFWDKYPNKNANEFVLRQGRSDDSPDLFFFSMPEEMTEAAARHGLSKLRSCGVDWFLHLKAVDAMDDEKFEAYMVLVDEMFAYESCVGMANHALLICRKGVK